jgi:hypothetical protein
MTPDPALKTRGRPVPCPFDNTILHTTKKTPQAGKADPYRKHPPRAGTSQRMRDLSSSGSL